MRCCMDGFGRGPHTQSSLHTLAEVSSNHVQSRGRSWPGHSLQPEGCFADWASLFVFFSKLSRKPKSSPGAATSPPLLCTLIQRLKPVHVCSAVLFFFFFFKVQFIGKYPNILANISLHINVRVIMNRYPTVFHTG